MKRVLAVGKRIRLVEGGPVHVVVRVNLCAAYIKSTEREHRVVRDKRTGEVKAEFDAPVGGLIAISPTSFVDYVDEPTPDADANYPPLDRHEIEECRQEDGCSDFEAEA